MYALHLLVDANNREGGTRMQAIERLCTEQKVPISYVASRNQLSKMIGGSPDRQHQVPRMHCDVDLSLKH